MNPTGQLAEPVDREAAALRAWTDLRQAVWEISQFATTADIADYVQHVLFEIEDDAP